MTYFPQPRKEELDVSDKMLRQISPTYAIGEDWVQWIVFERGAEDWRPRRFHIDREALLQIIVKELIEKHRQPEKASGYSRVIDWLLSFPRFHGSGRTIDPETLDVLPDALVAPLDLSARGAGPEKLSGTTRIASCGPERASDVRVDALLARQVEKPAVALPSAVGIEWELAETPVRSGRDV